MAAFSDHGSDDPKVNGCALGGPALTAADITMVIGVRLHEDNPWVLTRLHMMSSYYDPKPKILIVDFGSRSEHSDSIRHACEAGGMEFLYVDDTGVFSPSIARNRGFESVDTDLVYFCDIDCFSERDIFRRLAESATALNMASVIDVVINLPVYHLNRTDSVKFELGGREEASLYLTNRAFHLSYSKFQPDEGFFVAPYSNVFLINRKMFSITGGYDESFRGHGSDDFEFLVRLAIHCHYLPLPCSMESDVNGPLTHDFFDGGAYLGFRRLFELMSQPSEAMGLRTFHLNHDKNVSNSWYSSVNSNRDVLNSALSFYYHDLNNLISVDYINRGREILCFISDVSDWSLLVPLRLFGFRLVDGGRRLGSGGGGADQNVAVVGRLSEHSPGARQVIREAVSHGGGLIQISVDTDSRKVEYRVEGRALLPGGAEDVSWSDYIEVAPAPLPADQRDGARGACLVSGLDLFGAEVQLRRAREFSSFDWRSYAVFRSGVVGAPEAPPSAAELEASGVQAFTSGDYRRAADLFEQAFKLVPARLSLLRRAAEGYVAAGASDQALACLDRFLHALPNNRRVSRRRMVIKYPSLRYILGSNAFRVDGDC